MSGQRWTTMALLSALAAALAPACGGSVETSTSSGAGTGAGGGGVTSSSNATTSASSGGSGKACGGFLGMSCASNELCDFPDNLCGAADGSGTCVARPGACDDIYQPVCACDGKVYPNACSAATAGVDVSSVGSCATPPGKFTCGPRFCAAGKEYCQRSASDVGGVPDSFDCKALPTACGAKPSCGCLTSVPCGAQCVESPGGTLAVTCPGG